VIHCGEVLVSSNSKPEDGIGAVEAQINLANFTDPNQLRRVIAARAAQSVPGERFELPTNGLQNRPEVSRQGVDVDVLSHSIPN